MCAIFSLIIVYVSMSESSSEENTYYSNGWRPISNEKVLLNLHTNLMKPPETGHIIASWNPIVKPTDNIQIFEQNALIKPQDINTELIDGNYDRIKIDENKNQQEVTDQRQELSNKNEYSTSTQDNITPIVTRPRKAKKISADNLLILNDHKIVEISKAEDTQLIKSNVIEKSNTYEVTEASEAFEVKDLLDDNQVKKGINRPYFGPTFKTTTEENLTNKLFSILGNYNIKTNDDLTNYALSRNKYSLNFSKQGYVYSAPPRHNSQNYFPIDPLLAVFLSNYGYYLPGLYGFPGNFYNIYGYLAANNIHNNKPFGAYKIFADTDSSH